MPGGFWERLYHRRGQKDSRAISAGWHSLLGRGLHRNTLGYQIRQIALITGCDLDDPRTAFGLQVALEAERAGHEASG